MAEPNQNLSKKFFEHLKRNDSFRQATNPNLTDTAPEDSIGNKFKKFCNQCNRHYEAVEKKEKNEIKVPDEPIVISEANEEVERKAFNPPPEITPFEKFLLEQEKFENKQLLENQQKLNELRLQQSQQPTVIPDTAIPEGIFPDDFGEPPSESEPDFGDFPDPDFPDDESDSPEPDFPNDEPLGNTAPDNVSNNLPNNTAQKYAFEDFAKRNKLAPEIPENSEGEPKEEISAKEEIPAESSAPTLPKSSALPLTDKEEKSEAPDSGESLDKKKDDSGLIKKAQALFSKNRKKETEDRSRVSKKRESLPSVPPPVPFKVESDRKVQEDIKDNFEREQLIKNINGILLNVKTITKNDVEITNQVIKKLEKEQAEQEKREKENLKKEDNDKKRLSEKNNGDTDKPVELPRSVEEKEPIKSEEEPENPIDLSKPNENTEPPKPTEEKTYDQKNAELPDKDKTEIKENKGEMPKLRDYQRGEAPVEKPKFGKPVELKKGDYSKYYVGFTLAAISLGAFLGVKANSYNIYTKGKETSFVNCLISSILQDVPTVILPINSAVFLPTFLIGVAIVAVVGFSKITDIKNKEERRAGHEHGKARFGESKDFEGFKKQFMDMSLTENETDIKPNRKSKKN